MPPMTSTTRSTSSRATRPSASVVNRSSGDRQVAGAAEPADGDADQLQRRADARLEVLGGAVQQPDDLGADGAAAEQGDAHQTTFTGSCWLAGAAGAAAARRGGGPAPARPARGRRRRPAAPGPRRRTTAAATAPARASTASPAHSSTPTSAATNSACSRLGAHSTSRRSRSSSVSRRTSSRAARRARRRPAGGRRGCSCWPSSGGTRRTPGRRRGRPGARSPGSGTSCTTMSPLSQCFPHIVTFSRLRGGRRGWRARRCSARRTARCGCCRSCRRRR